MSERYFGDNRRRGPTAFGAAGRRTAFGYWVPLALTVTVAAVGLAAWVWSERNEDDDDYNNGGGQEGRTPIGMDPGMEDSGYTKATSADGQERMPDEDHSMMSRVQDAWRRTPSPQQFFDGASKKVAAGVAAAGAAVGGALGAIREERPGDFEDHSRWAEEPDASAANAPRARSGVRAAPPATSSKTEPKVNKKKTVAIVISSVSGDETDHDTISEHASILAHLPEYVEPDTARVFVLIYAPGLQLRNASDGCSGRPALSMTSSYANINAEEVATAIAGEASGLKTVEPKPTSDEFPSASAYFKTLYSQAQVLVDKETMIMPFNTPTGHVHILRHIAPDFVYIQESLTGHKGETVHNLTGWVRQVVVVVGAEGARGPLVDSDDESALGDQKEKWWQKEGVIGLGKRIDVVDAVRVGDDWKRRVCGHD